MSSDVIIAIFVSLANSFLIDFISGPVSIGFTSAAAIIIATTQVKDVLGLSYPGGKFLQVWEQIFEHISETRPWDALLGFTCMAFLLILRQAKDFKIGPDDEKERKLIHAFLTKVVWLISTARNIIVVIVSACFVKPGLPSLTPPPFTTQVGNKTYNFLDMASTLGSGVIVVPLLSILENIALAKVFSEGKTIDATQEMLALGVCNIANSFVSSMPVSGALSRGAVNNASGVKTTFGGVYTGIIASLAAVIIAAVVFMVELHVIKPIWRTKKTDLIPAIATFLSCLFLRLEIGIVIGIGINVIFLLYATARPSVLVEKVTESYGCDGCEYLVITPDRSLTFPSVEYVRGLVSKAGVKQGSSSIPGIKSLIEDFHKRNQPILFYNLKPSVINIFQGVQPKDFVYCETYLELNELLKQYCSNLSTATSINGDKIRK
ncbi:hypothetical protein NQ314_009413 [Rhamnusium bicolor]|uniref:SLC26A/SulP transporter domain-containing protein n=1 Tax=Rhamnusium bicolor TaxID=1586634 RepID=A0AAV8Y2D4_9CUCU|nr:hypothetical protein NQ314_009413 [Rhamnusium bicolor]